MTEYVLCYASAPWEDPKDVLLIRKNRPAWQAGRLNLPGGKVEIGENVKQAATREMFEETGLRCSEVDVTILGTIVGEGFIVYCCHCQYEPVFFDKDNEVEFGKTDEGIDWYEIDFVLKDKRLLPNLKVTIPLMKHKVGGWIIESLPETCGNDTFTLRFL